jgi:hypothetical protein
MNSLRKESGKQALHNNFKKIKTPQDKFNKVGETPTQ